MCAPSSPAVRPFTGGVPRRAAPSDASERASGKKRPRVAPARESSSANCLTEMTRDRSSVVAAAGTEALTVGAGGGEMPVPGDPAQEHLKKRLASELDALRGLLKKAELISRRGGACKGGGAPIAGKKERFLASSNQRPKPIEDGEGNAPLAKRRKISTPVEQKQEQAPRMSPEERNQVAGRLSALSGELPGHIVEFLQKQFGDADSHGEIEINMDTVQDSVLFELKTRLDKLAEESKHGKVAEKSNGEVVPKQEEEHMHKFIETGNKPRSSSSSSSGDSGECVHRPAQVLPEQTTATPAQPPPSSEPAQVVVQQGTGAKMLPDVRRAAPKAVSMRGLIYGANLRRQLLEMERAARVLPDQSIPRRELQRLGIAEYGSPSVMRQIGLVLKADA